MGGFSDFMFGTPEIRENVSTLRPEQEGLYKQLTNAGLNRGAGGAFGNSADYYRNLMGDDSEDFNSFANPELRRFRESIIPDLAEQFAGMGSGGGISSSGFRNASVSAGTDLSERLGAIRAQLRQQGAQGLAGIGQMGLQNYSQNMVTQPGSEGFLSTISPLAGSILSAAGGPAAMAANTAINAFGKNQNMVGQNSSPYRSNGGNSGGYQGSFGSLPQYNPFMRG